MKQSDYFLLLGAITAAPHLSELASNWISGLCTVAFVCFFISEKWK